MDDGDDDHNEIIYIQMKNKKRLMLKLCIHIVESHPILEPIGV